MSIVKVKKRGRPIKAKDDDFKSNYMNVSEVSKLLNISASHIYTLTSQKKIPHIKLLGKKLLFDKIEIKNWLKSKSISAK
jgi:excisionase family DNA binding protein